MYDATGVRLHAGRQAEVLNQLIVELPRDHPLTDSRPLRDSLGHTPVQVAVGALLGMVVGYAHFNMWLISQGVDVRERPSAIERERERSSFLALF